MHDKVRHSKTGMERRIQKQLAAALGPPCVPAACTCYTSLHAELADMSGSSMQEGVQKHTKPREPHQVDSMHMADIDVH